MKALYPLALMLALAGCGSLDPFIGSAIEKGRATADTAARGNLALLCATTVGAYFRLDNPRHQEGMAMICANGGVPLPAPE